MAVQVGFEPTGLSSQKLSRLRRYDHFGTAPNGADRRTWTPDLVITNHSLYQLSYISMWWALLDSNQWLLSYELRLLTNWIKDPNKFGALFGAKAPIVAPGILRLNWSLDLTGNPVWQKWSDSNWRITESKSVALPLGDTSVCKSRLMSIPLISRFGSSAELTRLFYAWHVGLMQPYGICFHWLLICSLTGPLGYISQYLPTLYTLADFIHSTFGSCEDISCEN